MKVLFFGHKGWIGQQLKNLFNNYPEHTVYCSNLRIDDYASIEKEIIDSGVTHIISFTGRTHGSIGSKVYPTIDYLEQDGKLVENVRDNLYGPIVLARLCEKYNIHLTYLGTGCIFDYDETHPYGQEVNGFKESDVPNYFDSSYSVVKGFTDRIMHMFENNVLNVRIRMPITACDSSRNFINKITTYQKVCSIPNSMTVLPELLPCVIDMASKGMKGTVNLTNPGLISHNEILEMYKEIVNPNFNWVNFTKEEQAEVLAAGRSNNFLNTDKLKYLYPQVNNIKESVRNVLLEMKHNNSETCNCDMQL